MSAYVATMRYSKRIASNHYHPLRRDRLVRAVRDDRDVLCFEFIYNGYWAINELPPTAPDLWRYMAMPEPAPVLADMKKQIEAHPEFTGWTGSDEDCECGSVCSECENCPVCEQSCIECGEGFEHEPIAKWRFAQGRCNQTCDDCLERRQEEVDEDE